MNEDIQLWRGDCLELMKNIPDKSVDAIICDLPYGTTACAWNKSANKIRPPFLTEDFCNQHKRRLFAKNPEHYKQFA